MTTYIEVTEDGLVLQALTQDVPPTRLGSTFHEYTGTVSWVPPNVGHELRWVDGAPVWVDIRTLEEVKAAKWEAIKKTRSDIEYLPLTVGEHIFDANQESQQKIAGAVQLALIADPSWSIDWTLTNNTTVNLARLEMVGVGVALGLRTGSIYATARTIRSNIDAATSIAEVESIHWPL